MLKVLLALRVLRRVRNAWRWLTAKYTCDVCGRTVKRREGKADVTIEQRDVFVDLARTKTTSVRVVTLRCPQCAEKRRKEPVDGEQDNQV